MCNVPCEFCGDYDECLLRIDEINDDKKLDIKISFDDMDFVELEGQQHFEFEFKALDEYPPFEEDTIYDEN